MDKITRKQAIARTRAVWKELAETGSDWKGSTKAARKWFCGVAECFLCVYDKEHGTGDCKKCPLLAIYPDGCDDCSNPYPRWEQAKTREQRKKYAKVFYVVLLKLK